MTQRSADAPTPVSDADAAAAGGADGADGAVGWRAARTRDAIVDASRRLFLDRGYAGTRINNITDACGISRAGFYTYFKDKRAVFNHIGAATYHEVLNVIGEWDRLSRPTRRSDVIAWVRRYFAFLDVHGAFILSSAQSAPTDDEFRRAAQRMQMRVGILLGTALRSRQRTPTAVPETLGLAMVGMLDRGWFHARAQGLPVDDDDMITTLADVIGATLAR